MSLLPLELRLSPPHGGRGPGWRPAPDVAPAVAAAVWQRDLHTCRYCGFRAERYQDVVVLGDSRRDVDAMVTACHFCRQCNYLGEVPELRSGVLIWLPELTQMQLNHVARELYVARITRSDSERGRRALDHLMTRRAGARDKVLTDDPKVLCQGLVEKGTDVVNNPETSAGLRLFPLDRRILRLDEPEFNQFPQVLAYWRSKQGPYHSGCDFAWMRLVELLFGDVDGQTAAPTPARRGPPPALMPVGMATQLLRDAADYIANVAAQQPELAEGLADTIRVYRQVAVLLDENPRAELASMEGVPLPDNRMTTLAARLLDDSAGFFENVGQQNPPLQEQMDDSAGVYREVAALLREAPHDPVPE